MGKELLSNKSYAPLVSIIMPVYNAERYLRASIRDILSQTYEKWELICIDDGSADNSLSILKFFADKDNRIKIVSQTNQGAGAARNVGIKTAKGDYLLFLDADDRFELKLLETTTKKAEQTNADVVIFDGFAFGSQSGCLLNNIIILNNDVAPVDTFCFEDTPENVFQISYSCAWNKLYKKEFIINNNLWFQETPYLNDVYFTCLAMVLAKRISVLRKKLVVYRRGNNGSISFDGNRRKNPDIAFLVMDKLFDEFTYRGLMGKVGRSFAKYAYVTIYGHIVDTLDENTYKYLVRRMDEDVFKKYGIDKLEKDDFDWEESYKDIKLFYKEGTQAFLARSFRRYAQYFFYKEYWAGELKREEKDVLYFFDIGRIPQDSKLIIYGAGHRGRQIYNLNKVTNKYKIALWVDKNAKILKGMNEKIFEPSEIQETDFDYVVIAIDDFNVAMEIMNDLLKYIPFHKIII